MRFSNEDHRALLRGEIDSDEYVRRVRADVDARLDTQDRARRAAALTESPSRVEGEQEKP